MPEQCDRIVQAPSSPIERGIAGTGSAAEEYHPSARVVIITLNAVRLLSGGGRFSMKRS